MQWIGDNADTIEAWTGGRFMRTNPGQLGGHPESAAVLFVACINAWVNIKANDWILREKGLFRICDGDFEKTYEAISDNEYTVQYIDPYNPGMAAAMRVTGNNEKEAEANARLWWGTTPITVTSVHKA